MDQELKDALDRVTGAVQRSTDATAAATAAAERSTVAVRDVKGAVDDLAKVVGELGRRVTRLEATVHGSDPPGPDAPAVTPPLDEIATDAAETAEGAADGVASLERDMRWVISELRKQSRSAGIGVSGWRWLFTPKGRADAFRLATLIAAAYAALHAVPAPQATNPAPLSITSGPR